MGKRFLVAFAVLASIGLVVGAMFYKEQTAQALPARNLKFYPKDMKQAALYKEMRRIQNELGVRCAFCHVMTPRKQFEKDTKHKAIALKMLRLTDDINKDLAKIFPKNPKKVTCYTCHRGKKHPVNVMPEDDE